MFSRLVASSRGRSQFRSPAVIVGSLVAHAALLAAIVWASTPHDAAEAPAADPNEEVTYIDITAIEPEMVFEEPAAEAAPPPEAAPQQPAPRAAPRAPAVPRSTPAAPSPATVQEPAGFQELQTPPRVLGIPPPDPTAGAVRAEDFGGRGAVGGSAAGARADAGAARDTATRTGTGTGTAAGPPTGTFSANLVDRTAAVSNHNEVVRLMQRLYPRELAAQRIEGTVHVQFVVTADGRVDMSTVRIVSSTHPQFAEATERALREFRFRPARMGEHNVRMLTELPIQWTMARD